jgi:hypothetical protein
MKKVIVSFSVAVAMLISFAWAAPQAHAQVGTALNINWSSSFQVQNLSDTSAASGQILFYAPDGSQPSSLPLEDANGNPIPAGASVTYNAILINQAPGAGFDGSAVIVSDTEVAAILNIAGTANDTGIGYNGSASGISQGASSVGLPLVQRQPGAGFDTWFVVQNAGDATTNVTATFSPASDAQGDPIGESYTPDPVSLEPGASTMFNTETLANNIEGTAGRFVGSVTVTSDNNEELAVIANQTGTMVGRDRVVNTYGGFGSGSTTLSLPLIQNANAGFFTGVAVQNVSETESADVTVSFSDNRPGLPASPPADITDTLQPGESLAFNTAVVIGPLTDPNNRYVGAATVTTSGGEIVAVVNQNRGVSTEEPAGVGTSYEGFSTAGATQNASAPLLMSSNAGFVTSIQCQNTTGTAGTLDITYAPNVVDNGFQPTNVVDEALPANGSATIFQANRNDFGPGNLTAGDAEGRYVGSGTISADVPIVCVVNQQALPGTNGDTFLTYNAINY